MQTKHKSISKSKETTCKECGSPCRTGKRGLCDKHYALYIKTRSKKQEATAKAKEKKAKLRKKKAESVSKLTKKLDTVFSLFIRLRDTDANGIGRCIDCGEIVEWSNLQCGHFASRTKMSTRWDEQNCAGQKDGCNMFQQGRQFEFSIGLDERYGAGTALRLITASREVRKYTSAELLELIEIYRGKVIELAASKAFEVKIP